MPRRKKNGLSPARVPGLSDESSLGYGGAGYRQPRGHDGAMATNFSSSTSSLPSSEKEKIVKNMQEMFSHLDPEVIYIVLSECDFKVENAMDSLLELSVAAEDAGPQSSYVSGFELTAAALLNPHVSGPCQDKDPSKPEQLSSSPLTTPPLTEEIDLELETLTKQSALMDEIPSDQYLTAAAPLSSFPPPPVPQQVLPELLQSSQEPGAHRPSVEQPCPLVEQASSPLNQLSYWEEEDNKQQSVLDFTHLTAETPADKPKLSLDLGACGRPSAFQVYKKQEQPHTLSERTGGIPPGGIGGGARSKVSTESQETFGNMTSSWNPEAPAFCPRFQGNQGLAFITPVAQTPSPWHTQARQASHWLTQGPVRQAPLKPSATVPKSWAMPAAPQGPTSHSRLRLEGRVLVLLRGAPGSGKSTMARAILEHNPGAVVLSTDDYFTRNGEYQFDLSALGEAHEWNQKRAKEAFESGANPIIIDNTNMQGWEMRPYVNQALKHKYKVLFREPDTWWKNKPRELGRRSKHNVPVEKIRRMLDGYERFVSIQSIMGSQPPERKQLVCQENTCSQPRPMSSETPRPDLVGEPGRTEKCEKSHSQLSSSLPDVSSIGHSGEMGILEDSSHNSAESLNLPSERLLENPDTHNENSEMDVAALDSELDIQLNACHLSGAQGIPDCIVESVLNEDHHGDETPMAFSESIGQRVRRERQSRYGSHRLEPADLVKDTNQSRREGEEEEGIQDEGMVANDLVSNCTEKGRPELLDFIGDWPAERGMEQRQLRRRERDREQNREKEEGMTKGVAHHNNAKRIQPAPDVTEFQKLLDLIQTGLNTTDTASSPDFAHYLSSEEESEREEDTGSRCQGSQGDRSSSEEREQDMNKNDVVRAELPDCVLDWKATNSPAVRQPPKSTVSESALGEMFENTNNSTTEGNDHMVEICRESVDLESKNVSGSGSADLIVTSEVVEAKVCHDGAGSHSVEGVVGAEGDADKDMRNYTDSGSLKGFSAKADESHIGEGSQSPVCEGTVEAESSPFSGGTQERKQQQGRRSGKQCRLALTFTQNCPSSSSKTLEDSTSITIQNLNSSQSSIQPDAGLNSNPECHLNHDPKSKHGLYPEPSPKLEVQPHIPVVDSGCPTQTDPQDFALLWRLSRHDSPDNTAVITGSHPGYIRILTGDPSRFVPEVSCATSAAVAVHPSGHSEVPYRVVHEKGTQVEEKDLGCTGSRLESLRILSRHFKLVSFDTLEDLYDKCHQDLEWTTNLLLDSGERFFRDEDGEVEEEEEEQEGSGVEDDQNTSCSSALDELDENWQEAGPASGVEVTLELASGAVIESAESDKNTALVSFGGVLSQVSSTNKDHPDETLHRVKSPPTLHSLVRAVKEAEGTEQDVTAATVHRPFEYGNGAYGGSLDDAVIIEDSRDENGDGEMSSMEEITQLMHEIERTEKKKREEQRERRDWEGRRDRHLDIQSVELKLPTELALQLTELFGPVGIDPAACSTDDYAVRMDLNLAKMLHQKWKDTIQEKQRQEVLSYHLLQESSVHWGESQATKSEPSEWTLPAHFLIGTDAYSSLSSQPKAQDEMPFMDHWSVSRPHVSLRDIMTEEQARQDSMEKTRKSRADLDRRDGATLLKENQLYALFPTIDRHFLQDIFRDHNYCLVQTEQFLNSLLDEGPVKTVIAPGAPRSDHHRAASNERDKQKPLELALSHYQDIEDPEYEDFRAEASLQRRRQIESFSKAAEAFKQGRKDVASYYAQQGHLHGQRMREANHRAAAQIFERVNSSLLPKNILDLHGLHVDEALEHLDQVLEDKTAEYEQGLCRPQLSVITGRGNHSQGGVARIRPAVIDYLTNKHYRFTEPKPGLVLVSLN
ncbi:NEDD4-binding protein 2 isoform X2 [Myripristis murdjan]|uniref:NEDD4-binding protein 2 isoform X2 n=1 Tax=Myripristis murdjan TaxID=586833 RepID=UPI00117603D9|nr:NEDD4-binding protein 2 isoform X2 [Myripristis murdjan]